MKKLFVSCSLVCASFIFLSPAPSIKAMKNLEKKDQTSDPHVFNTSDTPFFVNIEKAYIKENKFAFWTMLNKNTAQANRFDLIAKVFQIPKYLKFFSDIYCFSSFNGKTKLYEILESAITQLKKTFYNAPHMLKIIEAILTDNGIMTFVIACPKSNDKAILQQIFVLFAAYEYSEGVKRLLENERFSKLVEIEYLKKAQIYYPDNDEPTTIAKAEITNLLVHAIEKIDRVKTNKKTGAIF